MPIPEGEICQQLMVKKQTNQLAALLTWRSSVCRLLVSDRRLVRSEVSKAIEPILIADLAQIANE